MVKVSLRFFFSNQIKKDICFHGGDDLGTSRETIFLYGCRAGPINQRRRLNWELYKGENLYRMPIYALLNLIKQSSLIKTRRVGIEQVYLTFCLWLLLES